MEASNNMKAVQIMCQHKEIGKILLPLLNIERDEIDWKRISYAGLPGGFQAAISWVYAVFCDHAPPEDWVYRDPFDSFFAMDRDLQMFALQALAIRHGFVKVTIEDKPKSDFVKFLEKKSNELSAELDKNDKKKKIKLVE